jgi:hypothetical protein
MSQLASHQSQQPGPHRIDLYHDIHKGLRACLCDAFGKLARMDLDDVAESEATIQTLRDMLRFCISHVEHENAFIHTAMEARHPGSSSRTSHDHPGHEAAIAALTQSCDAFEQTSDRNARRDIWNRLQRDLALFIGENLVHMEVEESHNNRILQSAYSDSELIALHGRLVASLTPEEMATSMRWMMIGLAPEERLRLLQGICADAPAPAVAVVLHIVRESLPRRDWEKLEAGLSEPLAA